MVTAVKPAVIMMVTMEPDSLWLFKYFEEGLVTKCGNIIKEVDALIMKCTPYLQ